MKKKLFAWLMCLAMLVATLVPASADDTVIAKDYYGNDITALKQIATPSAIFSYKGDSPGSLKDGTDARWTAYSYTGTEAPWVQYDFLCEVTVESCVVRWYDDGGGCLVPLELDIQYWDGTQYVSVVPTAAYVDFIASADNTYAFKPVTTTSIRMVMVPSGLLGVAGKGMPAILEWDVMGKIADGVSVPKPDTSDINALAAPTALYTNAGDSPADLKNGTVDARWSCYTYTGTENPWVQYTWPCTVELEATTINWQDDGGGLKLPKRFEIQYWNGTSFVPVKATNDHTAMTAKQDNIYTFEKVQTKMLRIVAEPEGELGSDGKKGMVGINEWTVTGVAVESTAPETTASTTTAAPVTTAAPTTTAPTTTAVPVQTPATGSAMPMLALCAGLALLAVSLLEKKHRAN